MSGGAGRGALQRLRRRDCDAATTRKAAPGLLRQAKLARGGQHARARPGGGGGATAGNATGRSDAAAERRRALTASQQRRSRGHKGGRPPGSNHKGERETAGRPAAPPGARVAGAAGAAAPRGKISRASRGEHSTPAELVSPHSHARTARKCDADLVGCCGCSATSGCGARRPNPAARRVRNGSGSARVCGCGSLCCRRKRPSGSRRVARSHGGVA